MESKGDIYRALAAITGDTEAVGKDRKNAQQGYKFRGIDDLIPAIRTAMAKHGVTCVPRVLSCERYEYETRSGGTMHCVMMTVEHSFFASDGSSVTATTVGEGADSADKASNKAMTQAFKYALLPVFLLAGGEDSENDHPERSTSSRPAPKREPARAERDAKAAADTYARSAEAPRRPGIITDAQANRLRAIAFTIGEGAGLSRDQTIGEVKAILSTYGYESTQTIAPEHYDEIVGKVKATLSGGAGDVEGAFA